MGALCAEPGVTMTSRQGPFVPELGKDAQAGFAASTFEYEFLCNYKQFAPVLREAQEPGVVVVAIDRSNRRLVSVQALRATHTEPQVLIAGRLPTADLVVSGDPAISSRHFAVVVDALSGREPHGGVFYQVLSLRSPRSLKTERGVAVGGIRADGHMFLECGNHIFFFFVSDRDSGSWPESPLQAWLSIPKRVYLEDRTNLAEGSEVRQPPSRPVSLQSNATLVSVLPGPSQLNVGNLLRDGEPQVAELRIDVPGSTTRVPVGSSAIASGILFGRNGTPQTAPPAVPVERLSRAHLLIVDVSGRVFACDTASQGGVYRGLDEGERVRVCSLDVHRTVYLGSHTRVTWRWIDRAPT